MRPATLNAHGAVSEEVARIAEGAVARSRASAVAVTGIAEPRVVRQARGASAGLAGPDGFRSETVEFGARGRDAVRRATVDHALALLIEAVKA